MAVLYRKYRPQSFAEVLNQKYIIQTLVNQIKTGSVAHAYLFTGSRGVGKTSVARILAKAVNCPKQKNGEPCGKCDICQQFANGTFLDLVEIDAASNTGVDNIRDLIEHVKFSPAVGKYKVFIIDEVHMLSKGAFNALLKTLEEPPAHAIFILATTEIYKVPATIISRTQRFDFKRLGVADIESHLQQVAKLEKLKIKEVVLNLLAQHSEGSVRDALSLLGKVTTLGNDPSIEEVQQVIGATDIKVSQDLFGLILRGELTSLPSFIDSLLERGTDFLVLNRDFLEYLRQMLVYKMTEGEIKPDLEKNHLSEFEQAAGACTMNDIIFYLRIFLRSYKELDSAPSPELPFLLAAGEAALRKGNTPPAETEKIKPVLEPTPIKSTPKSASVKKEEPSLAFNEASSKVSLEELKRHWPEIITHLKEANTPLGNLVKTSPILGLENGALVLGVKFLFHKQNLEMAKNQSLIAEIIAKTCGGKVRVVGKIIKPEEELAPAAEMLSEALKIFGGEEVTE